MPTSHPQQIKPGGERPGGTTKKKRISDEEWMMHKENIERLYLDEGQDVWGMRDTMKRNYGFDAHEKAYKRKFEEWGVIKNIPKDEGLFMVKKRARRREQEGKETIFRRRKRTDRPLQLVLDAKVDRIADRYSQNLNSSPHSPASTPENIEYDTPDGTPCDELPRKIKSEKSRASSDAEWPFSQVLVDPNGDQYYSNGPCNTPNVLPAIIQMTAMTTMSAVSATNGSRNCHVNGLVNGHVNGQVSGEVNGEVTGNIHLVWDLWSTYGYFNERRP